MTKTYFVTTSANRFSIFADYDAEYISMMYATPTGEPYGKEFIFHAKREQSFAALVNEVCGCPDFFARMGYRNPELF